MKKVLLFFLLCPIFFTACRGEEGDIYAAAETSQVRGVESALPPEDREISGELSLDGSYDSDGALKRLWDRLVTELSQRLKEELGGGAALVATALFCSLAGAVAVGKNIPEYINIAGCSALAFSMAGSLDSVIAQASGAIAQLSDYSRAALPAVFTAAAACGAVGSAAARYGAVCIAMDVIIASAQNLIIPLIYAFIAISVSASIFDNPLLHSAARFTKWCATGLMTLMTLAFTAYIGISGVIAGSTDAAAVKTARTVISNALPVVGGIISDSASVLLSAASVIKNSAGVFGLIAVCAMCAGPFALLSVKMLVYKAAAAAADMLPGGKISFLINSVGTAFGMLLGLLGCCGIMLFISFMSAIKVVAV